jgi:type IV secretion system protein VirB9
MRNAVRFRVQLWGVVIGVMTALCARAETLPTKGPVDSRIRTALYSSDEVYRLVGFVGYDIELIFEPGERFTGKGGGDLEAVTIDAHENQVHIKPRAAVVATNLVIYTDRRAYRFDYSASDHRPNRVVDEVMYAVRFTYSPAYGAAGTAGGKAQEIERELKRATVERARNTDYWFCGSAAAKPVAASDDGVQTRLTFGTRAEIPAIFVRNADNTESLLNFSMDAGDVVIHRVAPQLIIRRGRLTGCIVNKGFQGAGERLKSGTVSPNVERDAKEIRP